MSITEADGKHTDKALRDVIFAVIILMFLYALFAEIFIALDIDENYFIFQGGQFLAEFIVIILLLQKYPTQILISRIELKGIVKYIIIGTVIMSWHNYPLSLWSESNGDLPNYYSLFIGYNWKGRVLFILIFCLLRPFTEEMIFRGLLYRILINPAIE